MELSARSRDPKELNAYQRLCVRQAKATEADIRALLRI